MHTWWEFWSFYCGIVPAANIWQLTSLSSASNKCISSKPFNVIIFRPNRGDRQVIPTYPVSNSSLVCTRKHATPALPAHWETLYPSPAAALPHRDHIEMVPFRYRNSHYKKMRRSWDRLIFMMGKSFIKSHSEGKDQRFTRNISNSLSCVNRFTLIKTLLTFVPNNPLSNSQVLFCIMPWPRTIDKRLSETMVA